MMKTQFFEIRHLIFYETYDSHLAEELGIKTTHTWQKGTSNRPYIRNFILYSVLKGSHWFSPQPNQGLSMANKSRSSQNWGNSISSIYHSSHRLKDSHRLKGSQSFPTIQSWPRLIFNGQLQSKPSKLGLFDAPRPYKSPAVGPLKTRRPYQQALQMKVAEPGGRLRSF